MSGRNRFPFTASQWQELEHQALVFKYMASGIPIPPELLYTIKSSCLDSPLSSKLFSRQPQHVNWNCFQMGLGRKVDPEPGRCRRTDGKKWRCSKEAYPDSKYCERHMHRGKNRSRKPVEVTLTSPTQTISSNPSTHSLSSPSSLSTLTHHTSSYLHHPSLYHHSSSSTPPASGLSHPDDSTHLLLDSGYYSHTNPDYRYVYGMKEEVDEHAFFPEPSGTMRSFTGSSMDDTWQLTPLTMSSSSSSSSKQRNCSGLESEYSYLQLQSLTEKMPFKSEREEEPQKTVHRFFDEWPPKNRDSWLDLDDKSSNSSSLSSTHLSISVPSSSIEFPIFNSRT